MIYYYLATSLIIFKGDFYFVTRFWGYLWDWDGELGVGRRSTLSNVSLHKVKCHCLSILKFCFPSLLQPLFLPPLCQLPWPCGLLSHYHPLLLSLKTTPILLYTFADHGKSPFQGVTHISEGCPSTPLSPASLTTTIICGHLYLEAAQVPHR